MSKMSKGLSDEIRLDTLTGISETPNCLYCNTTETIKHVYIECRNVIQLWQDNENWLTLLHNPQFKILDTEIFGKKTRLD